MRLLAATAFPMLAALLLVPAVTVGAQADAPPFLADAAGDMQFEPAETGPQSMPPGGRYASSDLLSLAVAEAPLEFTFTLTVGGFPGNEPIGEAAFYNIEFNAVGTVYRLRFMAPSADAPVAGVRESAGLYRIDPVTGDEIVVSLPAVSFDAVGIATVVVDRSAVTTATSVPIGHGQVMAGVHVEARAGINVSNEAGGLVGVGPRRFPVVRVDDRMPDSGGADWLLQLGGQRSGDLALSSPAALRATNGGPGSFLMTATVSNTGGQDRDVDLAVVRPPPGWSVGLSTSHLTVTAGNEEGLDLVVTPSTVHDHGRVQTFLLEARDSADSATFAQLEMGLSFVDPPQPAGHHPTLYVHVRNHDPSVFGSLQEAAGSPMRRAFLSTAQDDPLAQPVGAPGEGVVDPQPNDALRRTYAWTVPLHPGLLLGLHLGNGQVPLRLSFEATAPIEGFTLSGSITHSDGAGVATALWNFATPAMAAAANQPFAIEASALRDGNRTVFPFEPGSSLSLVMSATGSGPDTGFGPPLLLLMGGTLELSLLEYQDEVAVAGPVTEAAVNTTAPAAEPADAPSLAAWLGITVLIVVAARRRR